MDIVTTLEHIRDLAKENTKSPMDGYCQIYEWAENQLQAFAYTEPPFTPEELEGLKAATDRRTHREEG